MILVLLGTQNNSFNRLLEQIEKNIENGNIKEEVVVQAGYTKYEPKTPEINDIITDNINTTVILLLLLFSLFIFI